MNPQTCKWLRKIQTFQYWINDNPKNRGLLWICGGPGKGKTHLSTSLVTQLENTHMVLRYFCDTTNIQRSTELAVVLGLLNEVLGWDSPEELYKVIAGKFSGIGQDLFSDAYTTDLWDCLEKMIRKRAQNHPVYLVLDGLDECDSSSQRRLTNQLRKICYQNRQEEKNPVKVVIFSRPLNLHHQEDLMIDLHEDEILKWTEEDIRTILKDVCLLKQGKEEFCDILTKRANGTFLWVALALSSLGDRSTQQNIVDGDSASLDEFPVGLDAMYRRMLFNILERLHGKSHFKGKMEIFRCLTVSLHPLTKEEVGAITSLDGAIVDDALQAFQHILSIAGEGSADGEIKLVHLSLREFIIHNSSSLMAEEKCWSVWPRLYSAARWLREHRFRLWLVDYAVLATVSIYFQGFLYQRPALTFGLSSLIMLHFVSQKQRSSLLIGQFHKALERCINEIIMIIFCVREQQVHRFMFRRCIALMNDKTKGLKRDICDAEYPRHFRNGVAIEERCRRVRYPSRYWIRHLERSEPKSCEIDKAYVFLGEHFLHWLEAMGIFDVISEAAGELEIIKGIIQVSHHSIFLE